MRYSGVQSPSTVSAAIKRLKQLHLLEVYSGWDSGGFRRCNHYQLTPEHDKFKTLVDQIYQKHRAAIELEREYRKEQKKRRKAERTSTCKGRSSLQSA